jgi:hypothetical protein
MQGYVPRSHCGMTGIRRGWRGIDVGPVQVKLKAVNCTDTHHTTSLHAHNCDLQQSGRMNKRV